jgi:hypothetical protein
LHTSGHIVIPQFNSRADFQPSVVNARLRQQTALIAQTKNLSLTFVADPTNPRMRVTPKYFRRFLLMDLEQIKSSHNGTIGGLPFVASENVAQFMGPNNNAAEIYDLYRNSVFCPVLAGDETWQRRFFDAMACGCIPVVMSHELFDVTVPVSEFSNQHQNDGSLGHFQNRATKMSWFVPQDALGISETWSVRETYPYVDLVDYSTFTVECPGNISDHGDFSILIRTLDSLLAEHTILEGQRSKSQLEMKQEALKRSVTSFLYGVGPDAHRFDDAFAQLIRSIRAVLDKKIIKPNSTVHLEMKPK